MCGFFFSLNYDRKLSEADIAQYRYCTHTLTHRGPDSYGEYYSDHMFFWHRRLSIIDLNENAKQPMLHSSGRYLIVFNGEIYNYLEISSSSMVKFTTILN